MAGGPWCPTCRSRVLLEQDGRRCSNCKRVLIPDAPDTSKPARSAARRRAPATRAVAAKKPDAKK